MDELLDGPAAGMARAVRDRDVDPTELVDAVAARIAERNGPR
jgi:hypothetical protein